MQGKELKAIRHELGLSAVELGRALGYAGTDNSASVTIRRYEAKTNPRPIPPLVGRLAICFQLLYEKLGILPEDIDFSL